MRSRSLADLAYVAPAALVIEVAITFLVVGAGPEPVRPTSSDDVFPAHLAMTLLEPRDRFVLLGWWLSVPALLGVVWLVPRLPARVRAVLDVVLVVLALVVAVATALWHSNQGDPGLDLWIPRLPPWGLVLGVVAIVLSVATLLASSAKIRRGVSVVVVLGTAAFLLPALVQTPASIVEPWHATYTLDELIAPAVGKVPLVDYYPLYTNLLGFPIAPVIDSWPDHAVAIALGWVLILQLVTIAGVVAVGAIVGGRRTAPFVLLLVSAPLMLATPLGVYPTGYLAAVPLRTVLPVLTIVVALVLFGRRSPDALDTRGLVRRASAVGALGGLAALNNPDHGLPVLVAAASGVVLALSGWRTRGVAVAAGGLAAVVPFVAYAVLTALLGEAADWSKLLLFAQMFGPTGYGSVAIPAFGNHVGIVAFFAAATVVGVVVQARRRDDDTWRCQGLALTLCAGWALLTLPYYTGRSLPPQLSFGYAVQAALVGAAVLPLVLRAVRLWGTGHRRVTVIGAGSVALALLALGSLAGALSGAPTPGESLTRIEAAGRVAPSNLPEDTLAVESALAGRAGPDLRRLAAEGRLGQVVGSSPLVELNTGVPSVNVADQPAYLSVSVRMLRLQCEYVATTPMAAVIMAESVAVNLAAVEECSRVFVVEEPYRAVAEGFVLAEVRSPRA